MKKKFPLMSLMMFIGISVFGQSGHSLFGFLDLPYSSHANALGGSNISLVTTDLSMVWQNPALLGPEHSNELSLGYMRYIKGINTGSALYSRALGESGAWAAGVQFADYGEFVHTSADNQVLGTFGAKDVALNGMIGYDIAGNWRGGATAKFIYSAYESYTSVALAVDLGLNYYNHDTGRSLSLVARNLGGQLKAFDDTRESLPFDLQLGFTQQMEHAPFSFSVTAIDLTSWDTRYRDDTDTDGTSSSKHKFGTELFRHLVFGVEYTPTERFYLGAGYSYKRRSDFADGGGGFLSGFSAGAGVRIRMFDVNASIAQYHRSGTSFMIGIGLGLDKF